MAHLLRSKSDISLNAYMWEQVELLEDHARLRANLGKRAQIVRDFHPVHHDATGIVFLKLVYGCGGQSTFLTLRGRS